MNEDDPILPNDESELPAAAPQPPEPQGEALADPAVQQESEPTQEKVQTVPYDALHKERQRAKEAYQEKQRLERELAELRGMVTALTEQQKRPVETAPEPEEPEPDYEENPAAWMRWRTEKLEREQAKIAEQAAKIAEWRQQQEQTQQLQMQQAQVLEAYRMKAAEFAQQKPDFPNAYNHLVQSRARELMAFGIPQQQAYEQTRAEEVQLAALAMAQGINPAEAIYNLARERGWNGQQQAPAAGNAGQASSNQAMPPPSRPSTTPPTNIGKMPGAAGGHRLGLKELAKMSEEEFARVVSDEDFKKIMGLD